MGLTATLNFRKFKETRKRRAENSLLEKHFDNQLPRCNISTHKWLSVDLSFHSKIEMMKACFISLPVLQAIHIISSVNLSGCLPTNRHSIALGCRHLLINHKLEYETMQVHMTKPLGVTDFALPVCGLNAEDETVNYT